MQFPFNEITQLQSTAYYWTKTSIIDIYISGSVKKGKDVLSVFRNSWEYTRERSIIESFYQDNKIIIQNLDPFFMGCSEKLKF